MLEVIRQVDGRHPALTDLALDGVAAFEGSVEAGDRAWSVQVPNMRLGAADCEQIRLRQDGAEDDHQAQQPQVRTESR